MRKIVYRTTKFFIPLTIIIISSACSSFPLPDATSETGTEKQATLTIMTHDSFAVSEDIVKSFEEENAIEVKFIKSGDTGTAVNKAILSKGNPIADVFFGVDNTFLSRALDEDIFLSYESPILNDIDDSFKLDPSNRAVPVDYGDVCLNYDKNFFLENKLEPPSTLEDLLAPEYRELLVVENPATSSPGLAFLFTTIANFGEENYLEFWKGLMDNEVLIVNDWETAYYTEFSGSAGKGPRPIVVSYSSSPAFELIYAEQPIENPPTAAVVTDNTCFRQIEFVGILDGTNNESTARKWVDYMLSPDFQEDMPLQMFVFPVNSEAVLDDSFINYLNSPEATADISPAEIAQNRESWIIEWTETVLR
ncbi:MAG: thiamine ABC transporter substrate binding subunit [Anaerolineales bacterium]|jgi:thiamine transport system substrate-binding protein